jgi:hypothetical protein
MRVVPEILILINEPLGGGPGGGDQFGVGQLGHAQVKGAMLESAVNSTWAT